MSTPIEQERHNQEKKILNKQLQILGESLGEPNPSLKRLFFENCFTSDSSPSIEKHEILAEIAAKRGQSIAKVPDKFPVLRQKLRETVKLSTLIEREKRKFESSSNKRKTKKSVKKFVSLIAKRLELVTEIVDELWDYLPISGKEWIESIALKFIPLTVDDNIDKILEFSANTGKVTGFNKLSLFLFRAISRFLRSMSQKALDTGLNDQALSEQNIDETEYLFRSKKNAKRLITAIERSKSGITQPMTLDELYQELGISEEKQKRP